MRHAFLTPILFAALPAQVAPAGPQTFLPEPYLPMGGPTPMVISWRTDAATDGVVHYGTSPDNLDMTAASTSRTAEHHVSITGLQPGTRYYYSVGTPSAPLASGPDYYF